MVNDPISDLLTRIRNAQRTGHKSVRVECSKMNERILTVLKDEGFITYFEKKAGREGEREKLEVGLKYYNTGEPVIRMARRVSTPGRRVYAKVDSLPQVDAGLGISIISTSAGVMSDRSARRAKVGGEVLALIG